MSFNCTALWLYFVEKSLLCTFHHEDLASRTQPRTERLGGKDTTLDRLKAVADLGGALGGARQRRLLF